MVFLFLLHQAGHSVHIGGLMRLDIEQSSADYIYVTVWASSSLPLLMDKTKSASSIGENDYGSRLMVYFSLSIFIDDLVLLSEVYSK